MTMTATEPLRHPCFDRGATGTSARLHLPVAPKCNVQCRFCDRRHDCVNESRPGVTSAILSPRQAAEYYRRAKDLRPDISVVGIAGPGDAFASADRTLETLRLIREFDPDVILCVATNGLEGAAHAEELASLRVSHTTITINGLRPGTLAAIYAWARVGRRALRGQEAALALREAQEATLARFRAVGLKVKVNCVVLPGVNDGEIEEIAMLAGAYGAEAINLIPLAPTGTEFAASIPELAPAHHHELQALAGRHVKIMGHCQRCRADAGGTLGHDDDSLRRLLLAVSSGEEDARPFVAVATREGMLVSGHLGMVDSFQLFAEERGGGYRLAGVREAPPPGGGDARWEALATTLSDCRAILVGNVGKRPTEVLEEAGVRVIEMEGFVEEGLDAVFQGKPLRCAKPRGLSSCSSGCGGGGGGCA